MFKPALIAFVASLVLASSAVAKPAPGVVREQQRVVVAPGQVTVVVSELGGVDDTLEIGIRFRGKLTPWQMFGSGKALVWWRKRFTASATNDGESTRLVIVNTSRRPVRLRVLIDLLPPQDGGVRQGT